MICASQEKSRPGPWGHARFHIPWQENRTMRAGFKRAFLTIRYIGNGISAIVIRGAENASFRSVKTGSSTVSPQAWTMLGSLADQQSPEDHAHSRHRAPNRFVKYAKGCGHSLITKSSHQWRTFSSLATPGGMQRKRRHALTRHDDEPRRMVPSRLPSHAQRQNAWISPSQSRHIASSSTSMTSSQSRNANVSLLNAT